MTDFLKALQFYKDLRTEKKEKKRLLNMKTDFNLFEKLVQKCNDNPDLTVRVILTSGDIIEMKTVLPKQSISPNYNGEYIVG